MSINMSELLKELAAGEEARGRIPELERQVRDASGALDVSQRHAQELELRARDREDQISGLLARIRSLEVERDDAGFHVLEAEDKLAKLLKAVRHATSDLDGSVMQVDPPKAPEPAPAAEPVKEPEGNASSQAGTSGSAQQWLGAGQSTEAEQVGSSTQGQREQDPTASQGDTQSQNVSSGVASTQESAQPRNISDPSHPVDTRQWWGPADFR